MITQSKSSIIWVLSVVFMGVASGSYMYLTAPDHLPTHTLDWIDNPPLHCAVGKQKLRNNMGAARGMSIARGRSKLALKEGHLNSIQGFQTRVKKSEIRQGWLYSLVCKVDS